ncbi:SMP-30/gluconolactonase/LRE family protein [Chloroflexota bacterium]
MKVEEFDKKIRQIVPDELVVEHIATGFGFTEGPLWCGDYLLFSDIRRNRIIRLRMLREGPEITTFRTPSGNSNGLTFDRSGRLIVCEHSGRRVTRTEVDGSVSVLAERYNGQRLNSPNDVVVKSDGTVYFTDPSFGLGIPPVWQELPFKGVYRITPDGELVLLVDDFDMPNGLAFSPDETVLYVNDTFSEHIRAFDVSEDGSISNGRVFIEMKGEEEGRPDGMKVDQRGNVYCTGPGGLWIIQPDGKILGRVLMPELPANLGWSDPDWKTLYITARTSIYRMRLLVPGIAVP